MSDSYFTEEPVWVASNNRGGTIYLGLYGMDSKHIENIMQMLINKKIQRNPVYIANWIKACQDELMAREGEDPLWRSMSINEIYKARNMRRLVLGLPPMLPLSKNGSGKFSKPKRSLFADEDNQKREKGPEKTKTNPIGKAY